MRIDVGNALAEVATPGVPEEALERLDGRVGDAHRRIESGRTADEYGYVALDLPSTVDTGAIRSAVDRLPEAESVLLVGIGGSALGAATVADALPSDVELHVLDHLDPTAIDDTLDAVDLEDAVVHVVSRSGTTTETLANAAVVRAAMEDAGVDWTRRTLVTTGETGPLRQLADEHDLPTLSPPDGVPGRYAALSTMGLPVLAIRGHDIEALARGGRAASDALTPSLFDASAYAYGAVSYGLTVRGASVNAMMPYVEGLETFAEWFAQLWAESLGKDGLGQIPARALGVTDQHSQLQLYRDGPRSVQVSFVTVAASRTDRTLPANDWTTEAGIAGTALSTIGSAEFRGTEASLAAAGRPSVRLELPRLDERTMGELLVAMQASCMCAAELFGVNAFDQPAVEWGKRATRGLLRGEATPETDQIEDKRELVIEST